MDFGQYIKYLREKKELSIRELWRRSGVSFAHISQIERGERGIPKIETISKLAEGLNCTPDELNELMEKAREPIEYVQMMGRATRLQPDSPIDLQVLSYRLNKGLKDKDISIEQAATECGVTEEYILKLLKDPKRLPGVGTLYKLADLIDVTPDYLSGFTDDPKGHSPNTPRPKDMEEFLAKEEVMLYGKILSPEDKEKLHNVLAAVFMDAKEKNKRKK